MLSKIVMISRGRGALTFILIEVSEQSMQPKDDLDQCSRWHCITFLMSPSHCMEPS